MIVDAVGVTETDLDDTQPLDRKPTVPLERLLKQVAFGKPRPGCRLHDRRPDRPTRPRSSADDGPRELEDLAGHGAAATSRARWSTPSIPTGTSQAASEATGEAEPTDEQIAAAAKRLLEAAVEPLVDQPGAARAPRRHPALLRADHRRVLEGQSDRRRLLARRARPSARRRSIPSASSSRRTRTRSPRFRSSTAAPTASGSLQGDQGARERDRAPAAPAGRPKRSGRPTRRSTARRSAGQPDSVSHRPRLARPLRAGARERACPIPRACRTSASGRGCSSRRTPGARSRPSSSPGWSTSAITSPPHLRSAPTTSTTRHLSQQGGLGKAHEVFGEELTPLLDELNEALAA